MNYQEFKYYAFGLKVGYSNIFHNGIKLGTYKTLGKIFQPINSYSRFPEYYYFEKSIDEVVKKHSHKPIRILDIGSPKLFGLYLAYTRPVNITLTDFHRSNIEEYIHLWNSIKGSAKGCVEFSTADARSLCFSQESFDVVYAMSVIEHIEGKDGDTIALHEINRVVKQSGLVVVSIPFGDQYIEQNIEISKAYLTDELAKVEDYIFFQRIYDIKSVKIRLLQNISTNVELKLVSRNFRSILRLYLKNPLWLRALLGFLNPVLSKLFNVDNEDFLTPPSNYHINHKIYDIYSDLIWSYIKGSEVG